MVVTEEKVHEWAVYMKIEAVPAQEELPCDKIRKSWG